MVTWEDSSGAVVSFRGSFGGFDGFCLAFLGLLCDSIAPQIYCLFAKTIAPALTIGHWSVAQTCGTLRLCYIAYSRFRVFAYGQTYVVWGGTALSLSVYCLMKVLRIAALDVWLLAARN